MESESTLTNAIEEDICDAFPFQYPAVGSYPFYTLQNGRGPWEEGVDPRKYKHPNYTRLPYRCLENEKEPAVGHRGWILKSLVPLLYLSIFQIRDFCESIRGNNMSFRELCCRIGVRPRRIKPSLTCQKPVFRCGQWWKIPRMNQPIFSDTFVPKNPLIGCRPNPDSRSKKTSKTLIRKQGDWKHRFVIICSSKLENWHYRNQKSFLRFQILRLRKENEVSLARDRKFRHGRPIKHRQNL